MVSPLILAGSKGPRFLFNIGANVGPRCPNRQDDVEFVQLGYFAMVRDPNNKSRLNATERLAFSKIVPGAAYSGAPQDPLTLAISAHEASRGGAQDGHVSVARSPGTYDSKHAFIVVALNLSLLDTLKGEYPRLDKHPKCPGILRSSILRILTG
jgi:hypothetical protein